MAAVATSDPATRSVAIFPWGEVMEEFLHPLGLELDDFVKRMSGGWLFGYVRALQNEGWRPLILCASEAVKKATRLVHESTGAPIWAVPGKRSDPGGHARSPSLLWTRQWLESPASRYAEILGAERCGICIAQEYEYFRFDQLSLMARGAGYSLYATFQGGNVTLSAIERIVRPRSLRRCSGLIVASAGERRRLANAYPTSKVPVADIPNPIDTEEWQAIDRAEARRQLGLPQQAFVVINHGRTDIKRKGLDILVDAWARFAARRADAYAVVIGSGQDHAAFSRLLAERAPDRLTWVPAYVTDRKQMRQWLSAADAYLITSRTEGMPVAPLEAMACGLPVVSSDANGLPDIFAGGERHGGLLAVQEDVAGIVEAVDRLARDPLLRLRLADGARRRVVDHFSIAAVGAALASFISGSHRT